MKLEIFDIEGQGTGKNVDLPDGIFGIEPNDHSIYLAVKQHMANRRQGTHKSKVRNEITGSTKKIKKQKGTGTARAGDIKNPIFRGGGTVFGPEPRDYSFKLNKKVKTLARKSALAQKAKDESIMVIEDFSLESPKTKNMIDVLKKLGIDGNKVLMVVPGKDKNLVLATRNLKKTTVVEAHQLNTYTILNANKLLIAESSVKKIEETFASEAIKIKA